MNTTMGIVSHLTEGRGSNFMLYRSWETFGDRFCPPAPDHSLFGEWNRVNNPPLDISLL
jgi:hypothetical protein